MVKIIKYIEITAWLVSVYDFYARVVKDWKTNEWAKWTSEFSNLSQQVHNENCTNEQTNQPTSQRTNHASQLFSSTF
jgi:hypothetical protein